MAEIVKQKTYMKKLVIALACLASLASCVEQTHAPLPTSKRSHTCKRVIRPLGEAVVYAMHIDTAYRIGDTIRVEYTHDETRSAVVVR